MSYEIVKTLSFDFDKLTANIASSSNNVYPKDFSPWVSQFRRSERANPALTDKELFILGFIHSWLGGSLQFNSSVSNRTRYAFIKIKEVIDKNYTKPDWKTGNSTGSFYDYYYKGVYDGGDTTALKELAELFEREYNKSDWRVHHYILVDNSRYFVKLARRGMYTTPYDQYAKVFKSGKEIVVTLDHLKSRYDYDVEAVFVDDIND